MKEALSGSGKLPWNRRTSHKLTDWWGVLLADVLRHDLLRYCVNKENCYMNWFEWFLGFVSP